MTQAILFDLDGTLTDPRDGITRCVRHALATLNVPCPSEEQLLEWIGPPLQRSFRDYFGDERAELIPAAVSAYRDRFAAIGMFENSVYPGIVEALVALRRRGAVLFVATSKPTVFARKILQHFELFDYFAGVYGAELSGQHSEKGDLLAHLLSSEAIAPACATMIGDRAQDILGARQNGVRGVGVLWGYGSLAELREAGAHEIIAEVPDLITVTGAD